MKILDYQNYYLVGIKGVAMTALAECLIDAGKSVRGCDVDEEFVTDQKLKNLDVEVEIGFNNELAEEIECLVYTAAHNGRQNSLVQLAIEKNIQVLSYSQAISQLANQNNVVAVSGVGGKSTVTAMIAWITQKQSDDHNKSSYLVGVGDIPGLDKTGQWLPDSKYFVLEADEYVDDANDPENKPLPKLLMLEPTIVVCTNLKFDHPDVYADFQETKNTFKKFFESIKPGGTLIFNNDDDSLVRLVESVFSNKTDVKLLPFSENNLSNYLSENGLTTANAEISGKNINIKLKIPGKFNLMNAVTAIKAAQVMGVEPAISAKMLEDFRSTRRRFELVKVKDGVSYYDDYAHHPHEIMKTIDALKEWFPDSQRVVVFQPHTFSRTKKLFDEFVQSFSKLDKGDQLVIVDIFASAREKFDPDVTSEKLVETINSNNPLFNCEYVNDRSELARKLTTLNSGDAVLTMGAGDIYKVLEEIS